MRRVTLRRLWVGRQGEPSVRERGSVRWQGARNVGNNHREEKGEGDWRVRRDTADGRCIVGEEHESRERHGERIGQGAQGVKRPTVMERRRATESSPLHSEGGDRPSGAWRVNAPHFIVGCT